MGNEVSAVQHYTRPCQSWRFWEDGSCVQERYRMEAESQKRYRNNMGVINGMPGRKYTAVRQEDMFKDRRVLRWPSIVIVPFFLMNVENVPSLFLLDMYKAFTFEPLHNMHLGISMLLENCFLSYVDSEMFWKRDCGMVWEVPAFLNFKRTFLLACNTELVSNEKELPLAGLGVKFPRVEVSWKLNWCFRNVFYGLW